MRVSNAADAPAGPCSLPPLAHLVPGQETPARPSVPADCERRQENSGETKAVPRTAVQRLLSRRDIPLREKTLRRMLYETAARAAEILEIDVQDLDLDNRQAPIRSQRRRDPMGVLGHRHRPPAPALAAPARRHFSYERTAVPVQRNPSRPAGQRPATSARTPAGSASAMTAAASCWTTTPGWSSTSSGTAPRPQRRQSPAPAHHGQDPAQEPRTAMRYIKPGGEVRRGTGILGPSRRKH